MSARWFLSTAALFLVAAALAVAPPAEARGGHGGGGHGGGGGGHGGGGGGGGHGGGGFHAGGPGFHGGGPGFHGDGFGRGFAGRGFGGYGGWGWPGYGWGYRYPYYAGYGYAYSPGYVGYGYYPDSGAYAAAPDYDTSDQPAAGYQSFYPPATSGDAPAANGTGALVRVQVPDPNATVYVQGTQTTQRGTDRAFESPPLEPQRAYIYDIRARWTTPDGRAMDQTKHVEVHAGDRVTVDFNAAATQP